jgi:anti-sigma regulatory factor (Ser/Thr protein kinase)
LRRTDDDLVWDWSADVSGASQGAAARLDFRAHLSRAAAAGSDLGAAELIFGELLANVVRHAGGVATFRLEWSEPHPRLVVEDRGCGFAGSSRGSLEDVAAEDGRGLALVSLLAVKVSVGSRLGGGARVEVVLPVERPST